MQTKANKRTFASLGLCLLTAILSVIILFSTAHFLGACGSGEQKLGEAVAYIIYGLFIATACFFICRHNPKSLWYGPILCNAMGIISAIVEPTFWITPLWMFICGGWVLSVIGAISGAKRGRQSHASAESLETSPDTHP
jgi:hypothetical protein